MKCSKSPSPSILLFRILINLTGWTVLPKFTLTAVKKALIGLELFADNVDKVFI